MRHYSFSVYFDTKKITIYTVLAFTVGILLGGTMWNFFGIYTPEIIPLQLKPGSLLKFGSYEDLVNFLETRSNGDFYGGVMILDKSGRNFVAAPSAASSAGSVLEDASSQDYSGTNIQVEGVDEADVVKTDGEYIYLASENIVYLVKAYPPQEAELTSQLEMKGRVLDLFISGDKLVVFLSTEPVFYDFGWKGCPPPEYQLTTTIWVYDVSDRSSPQLDREVTVDGFYFNSRMIGDYVYLVTHQPTWVWNETVCLPQVRSGNYSCEVEATDVYYANNTDVYYSFTNIVAVNVQRPEEEINHQSFLLGSTSTLYASRENIYLTAPQWMRVALEVPESFTSLETTMVYKIRIDEGKIDYIADGAVPGRVLNQFSMDEHDGYFRIATTSGRLSREGGGTSNNVYVLNASLGIAGKLEDLAPGESIYSARFMGSRCYLVTFKKVDPLFVIDLAIPEQPQVLGKLKIPGYSDYLHPYDENTLIGVGKETEEAEEGDFAWYQGVKISLFDVSDVSNPRELAKIEVGDRGTDSPALHDHKAFLFSRPRNLLVIPILLAEIDSDDWSGTVPANAYGEYVFQGAYVFHVSTEQGINLRGRITHLDNSDELLKSGYWFESKLEVKRSLYIEEMLYTISEKMIKINSLDDLAEVGRIQLP